MKLDIEKWINRLDPLDNEAKELFSESVICYKIGAYRSAFIMSYLAFKITLKNRIINCSYRPEGFNEGRWQSVIIKELNNEDNWEKHLNDIIVADPKKEGSIAIIFFEQREIAKNEYEYWKNVRNQCAHAKSGIINSSTVECFWNYLQDNLSKFYVLGGKQYLLEELLEYYRYRVVENKNKLTLLIHDIEVVYGENACEFFKEFNVRFENRYRIMVNDENRDFWKEIIYSSHDNIQEGFIKSIMEKEYYFIQFYRIFPDILEKAISFDNKFILDKVSKWLELWEPDYRGGNNTFWDILYKLLKKKPDEVNIDMISRKVDLDIISNVDFDIEQLKLLEGYKVFDKFILNAGSYFFDVTFDGIRINNGYKERKPIEWFKYSTWNKELIAKLSESFERLDVSISNLKKSNFGSWEYERRKIYIDLIKLYWCNIEKVIEDENLTIYNKIYEYIKE
ncbi:hypothetical protein P9E76_12030 [Schinkia azotoformans]|uniref:Uncharacterized protein n=1 Tax=Schinkia azotoformans LMG 9581 TaxID=1131731 RepID=K6CRC5_SCHAZ|nr:hypothetical protein [Schinkia azotoformans]EKN62807.1 hypothetical protein BAZO_20358 [Schinkia azotoformans LMG 9581]MEC1639183.1 hypothetical protein [Schinkia azotoformans]MEC1722543.1 hypothetical protein [Schinkia azotoformans]MEC1945771.1 hypothetical protein [Schinkia azotoformans]MED4415774.1 hypothetical protein [Schinkia azotoformans]